MFAAFAALSAALMLWQWLAARTFPLHRKIAADNFAPAVSILKPLKGCDETTAASLASWFTQNYAGPVEIIFGVAEAGDPVCDIVRRLIAENSGVPAQLVTCENLTGANQGRQARTVGKTRGARFDCRERRRRARDAGFSGQLHRAAAG
jgi:ceramide glucosyltransferase